MLYERTDLTDLGTSTAVLGQLGSMQFRRGLDRYPPVVIDQTVEALLQGVELSIVGWHGHAVETERDHLGQTMRFSTEQELERRRDEVHPSGGDLQVSGKVVSLVLLR